MGPLEIHPGSSRAEILEQRLKEGRSVLFTRSKLRRVRPDLAWHIPQDSHPTSSPMSKIKAEYLWIDGSEPTSMLRSKTKVMDEGTEPTVWGFDGSSTNQATGDDSDCVLKPVFTCPDPIRGGKNLIVMCEVRNTDMTPHTTNTRFTCAEAAEQQQR